MVYLARVCASTNTSDPLHNIRLVAEEHLSSFEASPFLPEFLDHMEGISVIRCEAWQLPEYNPGPLTWSDRLLPGHQTQASHRGVALEYVVDLANRLNSSLWLVSPVTAAGEDPYTRSLAEFVQQRYTGHGRIYVEHFGSPRGSSAFAIESLTAWNNWEAVYGAASPLIVRVTSVGAWAPGSLQHFGSDIGRIDAVAIEATFGWNCDWGFRHCVDFKGREAAWHYADSTVDELLDLIRSGVLKREVELNTNIQYITAVGGFDVLASTGGPRVAAASFQHRATLSGATRCLRCAQSIHGHVLGPAGRANAIDATGYVHVPNFSIYYGYQGISPDLGLRAMIYSGPNGASGPDASYWMHDTPANCKAVCDSASGSAVPLPQGVTVGACAGFVYVTSGEWACGPSSHECAQEVCYERYGSCSSPGTCYFLSELQAVARWAPQATVDERSRRCAVNGVCADMYYRGSDDSGAIESDVSEACSGDCGSSSFFGDWPRWHPGYSDHTAWTLDALNDNWAEFERLAALELALEQKLVDAVNHPRMTTLYLDFLTRWEQIGGKTFVSAPLIAPVNLCPSGGHDCGQYSVMRNPLDASSPQLAALHRFAAGERAFIASTAATDAQTEQDAAQAACGCVWGVCDHGTCICFAGYDGERCDTLSASGTNGQCHGINASTGINLAGISDWSREWVFLDVMRNSRMWMQERFFDDAINDLVTLRSDGFPASLQPNQRLAALMLRDLGEHHPDGNFTVLWDGTGIVEFGMEVHRVLYEDLGRAIVEVDLTTQFNNGLMLKISSTSPTDPIRNVRVISPGYEQKFAVEPFHPAFLASLQRYKVLRFMDWMHGSELSSGDWNARTVRSTASYAWSPVGIASTEEGVDLNAIDSAPGAVSVEDIVRLSNTLGTEPWLTLPANADDTYMAELARFLKANLRPDIANVYVELGNELWHTGFAAGAYARDEALRAGESTECWIVQRTRQMAQVMRAEFGSTTTFELRVVVSSQATSIAKTEAYVACGFGDDIDSLGLAPYFNGYRSDMDSVDAVIAAMAADIAPIVALVAQHRAALPAAFSLVAYEAGPSGVGSGELDDLAIAAHRDPRMAELVENYYTQLQLAGMEVLLHFVSVGVPSKYGSWGLIEATDANPSMSPKQQGLFSFIDSHLTCPLELNSCAEMNECSGQGHCLADGSCSCYFAFFGAECADAHWVETQSCGYQCTFHQGTCSVVETVDVFRHSTCACGEGYFGATCSRFSCEAGCNYHGHCIDQNTCSCFRGFKGSMCEVDCGCNGHGQCRHDGTCICDVGWRSRDDGACVWDCEAVDTFGCIGPGQSACGDAGPVCMVYAAAGSDMRAWRAASHRHTTMGHQLGSMSAEDKYSWT